MRWETANHVRNWRRQVAGDCMALSLVPIPKNGVLLPTLGLPFERALSLHRKLGIASVLASLAHSAVYLWRWRDDLLMELNFTVRGLD